MKSQRRSTLRSLAAALLLGALPLVGAQAAEGGKPRAALIMKSLADEFFQTVQDGATAYRKEHANEFSIDRQRHRG